MNFEISSSGEQYEDLVQRLGRLGQPTAPATILSNALQRVGLADSYGETATPIGPVLVAFGRGGVAMVARADDPIDFERRYRERTGRPIARMAELPPRLRDLTGRRWKSDDVDLSKAPAFQQAVLLKALEIPVGEVRPYSWIAREIGRPGAVRAVGTALRQNPVPLIVPCHRVVRSDSTVGEYALGRESKRALLALEGANPTDLERLARDGVRFTGSDTTRIYCFPTCRHARRTTQRHLVTFRSEKDATTAGYRPCKVCRPALAS